MYEEITPHPLPLPMGEGTVLYAPSDILGSLLPGGEGQDEGSELRFRHILASGTSLDEFSARAHPWGRDERSRPPRRRGLDRFRRRGKPPRLCGGHRGGENRRARSPAGTPPSMPATVLPEGAWLAPGFIDGQVNGGGDILFNDEPTVDGIAAIAAAHRKFGTTSLLPTLITDTPNKMRAALDAAAKAAATNPSVAGIHIEGPFISPEKPGVHEPALIRAPARETGTADGAKAGCHAGDAGAGARAGGLRRRACEGRRARFARSFDGRLPANQGRAGRRAHRLHPSFQRDAQLSSRDPGPIAAALETPDAWFGMIADGDHVDPAMLRLALRGAARPMLVTDAMPPVGGATPCFKLYGREIAVREGSCTRADGTLAGSALDMAAAVRNCVELLQVPLVRRRCTTPRASPRGSWASVARSAGWRPATAPTWPHSTRPACSYIIAGSREARRCGMTAPYPNAGLAKSQFRL